MFKTSFAILFLLLAIFTSKIANAQGIQTDFGKSKIQYGKFDWYFYRTVEFEVYYNSGGKNLAQYVLTHAKEQLEKIEKTLDYKIGNRITFVIYNTYSDFKQSNITLIDETYNNGGLTPIVDNIAFVYFDGNHVNFDRQISQSLAEVLLNELLYGSSVQERIQNLALISLPEWYYKGLISYLSGEPDLKVKEAFEDGVRYEKFKRFGWLKPEEKVLISRFFWEYIATSYGKKAIANVLYLTHTNKSIESGFEYVVGKPFGQIYYDWYRFYRYELLSQETSKYQSLKYTISPKKFKKKGEITQVKLSPDGSRIVYVLNNRSKTTIWVYNLDESKKSRIFRKGYKIYETSYDVNYPLIDWHPNKDLLSIIYEKKAKPYFADYNFETKKLENARPLDKLNKILDFSYNKKGTNIVMSGIRDGSSDIYIYEIRSYRLFPITNDIFDDLNPHYTNNDNGIVFSSNRQQLLLEKRLFDPENDFSNSFDIYYFDALNKSNKLKRVTFTEKADESFPSEYDSNFISYLTTENGIINRNAAYLDSIFNHILLTVSYIDTARFKADSFKFFVNDLSVVKAGSLKDSLIEKTDTFWFYHDTSYHYTMSNYLKNIQFYDIRQKSSSILEIFSENKDYIISVSPIPEKIEKESVKRNSSSTVLERYKIEKNDNLFEEEPTHSITNVQEEEKQEVVKQDSFKYHFLSEFDILIDTSKANIGNPQIVFSEADIIKPVSVSDSIQKLRKARFGSSSSYFLSFTPDYLVSQIDNSFLNSPYLVYDKSLPVQPMNKVTGAFFMMGVNDLLKDYKISGGFRLKGNLSGTEYIMAFENLKKRLDKKVIFYRKAETTDNDYTRTRQFTNEGRVQFRFPFTELNALRMDVFVRQDRKVVLGSELSSLLQPDVVLSYTGVKLEYVFDNSKVLAENIRIGTRYKIYFQNFMNITGFKNEFNVIGADFRNYTQISKEIIWANRFAFESSIGSSKIVYLMGGVDNWLFPKYNEEIQIDPDINYVYKTLAVQLRGFSQNIRNGNSFGLINSELRIPVFKYFSSVPMKSAFIETFQLVFFADIGTAWTGVHPYSKDNTLNKRVIYNNPLKITVITVGEPIVGGTGIGIRANLLGYYIKVDRGWGIEAGELFQKMTYFSLGYDF